MVHVDIFLRPLISLSKSLLTICCCRLTYFSLPSHNGPVHHNHIQPINNTSSTWTNHKENQKVISRILLSFNVLCSSVSQQYIALCVLCSVGSSVLKNALYLIQSDRLSLSIIYRAIHFDQWDSSVSTTVSNSELSDCSVSTTELSDRSCIWYWVAFGRKFQF